MGGSRKRIGSIALAAATALAVTLSGCGGSSGTGAAGGGGGGGGGSSAHGNTGSQGFPTAPPGGAQHAGGTLTMLIGAKIAGQWQSLDPGAKNGAAGGTLVEPIYGGLVNVLYNGKIVPGLAKSWSHSADGKTWTVHLQQGVKFSDGTPFDAAAVKWNWERILAPALKCTCAHDFPYSSIDTPDATTLVVHLKIPQAAFMTNMVNEETNFILSPTAFKKMGEKKFGQSPVGAGPFLVETNKPGIEMVLKRNPDYWRKGRPYLDKVIIKTVAEEASGVAALQSGQADVMGYSQFQNVKSLSSALNVYQSSGGVVQTLAFNTHKAPFNNIKARQAVAYAINPESINKGIWDDLGYLVQAPTTRGNGFFTPKVPGTPAYNLAKAKQLVKELGGLSVDFSVVGQGGFLGVAEAVQTQLKRAGIKVKLRSIDGSSWVSDFQKGTWSLTLSHPGGAPDPAASLGLSNYFSSSELFSGVKDPTLDAMMQTAAGTMDKTQRAAEYDKIFHRISAEKVYAVFIGVAPGYLLTTKRVRFPADAPGLLAPASFVNYLWNVSVK